MNGNSSLVPSDLRRVALYSQPARSTHVVLAMGHGLAPDRTAIRARPIYTLAARRVWRLGAPHPVRTKAWRFLRASGRQPVGPGRWRGRRSAPRSPWRSVAGGRGLVLRLRMQGCDVLCAWPSSCCFCIRSDPGLSDICFDWRTSVTSGMRATCERHRVGT